MKYVNSSFTLPAGPGNVSDVEWKIAMGQAITNKEALQQYERERGGRGEKGWVATFWGWVHERQIKLKESS